jgi:hypothetical protein
MDSDPARRRRTALTALVIALLAGATAAFALTEALKLDRSALTVRRFDRVLSPRCRCPERVAWLVVRLREADTIDAAIVDADGNEVRRLATGLDRAAGIVRLRWAGRNDAGRLVAPGRYRLRVRLREKERTIVLARTIRVDASTPAG